MLNRLGDLMRVEPSKLLWEHTPFPYIVAFMPAEEVARHEEKALDITGSKGSLSALIQSVTIGLPALKLCPECVRSDRIEYGESYWHREHSIPTVHRCPTHNVPLELSEVKAGMTSRCYGFGLPQHQRGRPEQTTLTLSVERRLAELSAGLLARDHAAARDWRNRYRAKALELGYRMPSNDVATAHMASGLLNFYGESYLLSRSCNISRASTSWPVLMVREASTGQITPAKHLLLQVFLEQSGQVTESYPYRQPGKVPRDLETFDARVAQHVRRAGILANEKQIKTTATALLIQAGALAAFRHNRKSFPLTTAEINAFRQTEASERKIGGRAVHKKRMELRALKQARDA